MRFTYYGGGELILDGFARCREQRLIYYRFSRESVAYLRYKAEQGKLEAVVIDKVYLSDNTYTKYQSNVMYRDKLNSLFHEKELCTLEEAEAIIVESDLMASFRPKPVKPVRTFHEPVLPSTYKTGDIAFDKKAAAMGKLERVGIIRVFNNIKEEIYEDITKGLWQKSQLCNEAEAKALALVYWQRRKEQITDEYQRQT
jgi:hypothetical protein